MRRIAMLAGLSGLAVTALATGSARIGREPVPGGLRPKRLAQDPRAAVVWVALSSLAVPVFARQALRARDPRLFWLLLAAYQLKLCGAVARQGVIYDVYDGVADAHGYSGRGSRMGARFRAGDFRPELESYSGTDFVRLASGVVHTAVGPSQLSGFLVFSSLAFWGLFFFTRAFATALPHGSVRGYTRLVFFSPSLVFWPSSPGKEALMVFSLGMGALGAARSLTGSPRRGLGLAALGTSLAALVRPHVAGMAAVGIASGHLVGESGRRSHLSARARTGALLAAATAVACIIPWGRRFLNDRRVSAEGVRSVLEQVTRRTAWGGSRFDPPMVKSPALAPLGPATVLFRPHLLEAHNLQARVAAAEATFFLLLTIARLRWALTAIGHARRQPYVAVALAYSCLFTAGHSAFANFGLLSRQRSQLLPLYFVLLSVPPRRRSWTR